jgi:hypothetical protein
MMIKRLIEDLANDNITLTQALTRAKILAFQLDNEILQEWLKFELEGYDGNEGALPSYRKVSCEPKLRISDRWGRTKTLPMNFNNWPELGELLSKREIILGIPALEANCASLANSEIGIVEFPAAMIQQLTEMLKLREQGLTIEQGGQQINKLQLSAIIEFTRQKLIDTLLQINREFPDFNNDFKMSEENKDKAQNIITNNIYGSNNPVNLAAGHNVEQTGFNFNTTVSYSELEKYGVEPADIDALKTIVEGNQQNKPTLQSKAMHWLAGVSATVASKGLAEHLPAIVDFVQNLTR